MLNWQTLGWQGNWQILPARGTHLLGPPSGWLQRLSSSQHMTLRYERFLLDHYNYILFQWILIQKYIFWTHMEVAKYVLSCGYIVSQICFLFHVSHSTWYTCLHCCMPVLAEYRYYLHILDYHMLISEVYFLDVWHLSLNSTFLEFFFNLYIYISSYFWVRIHGITQ